MDTSSQNLLPLHASEIDDKVTGFPVKKSAQILITEQEYLELKNLVGYWQAMHKKAILRKKELKQTILEQEGQIRDLRNRVFEKKSEKKSSSKDQGKLKPDKAKRPRGQQPDSSD